MTALDLPTQPTSFVGRTHELAEIIALLDNLDCRMVTLVGPGGIGKTRLSLEVGARLRQRVEAADTSTNGSAPNFAPRGVYFVALQPLSSPDFIFTAIAEAVGFQFYAGGDPAAQLIDYLQPKSLLIILDNLEHLLDRLDPVVSLIANVAGIKLLVTSRETLNLREEWLYPVKGMNYPEQDEVADANSYSAVRLFVQSARRVRPDFSLAAEQPSILRICRLVEGMPLALEMTAAWLRRLPAAEIAREIERGLDILENPARNVPTRHRSIRAVFDHSWDLLTETEQDVFKKLSVFRGGFRREAAEAVACATLGSLSALVDKSLLLMNASGRYNLHELVRQYAEEKLIATPNANHQAQTDHAAYYMQFLDQRCLDMMIHMTKSVVGEITDDLKNIRTAMDWMLTYDNAHNYDAATNCLMLFYQFRCLYEEGAEVSGRVLANLRRTPADEPLGRMLVLHGWLIELSSQDYARAIPLMEEGLEVGGRIGYKNSMEGLLRLSDIAMQMGDYEKARDMAQQCVDMCFDEEEHCTHTFDLAHLGYVLLLMGDYEGAKIRIEEAVDIAQKHNIPSGLSDAKNYLGQVQLALRAYLEAKQTLGENVTFSKSSGYLKGIVLALTGAGEATMELGEYQASAEYLSEALKTALDSNQIPFLLTALTIAAALLAKTGHAERAAEILKIVLAHHATTYQTRSRATQMIARLDLPESPIAPVESPRASQIEKVVQAFLDTEFSDTLAPVPEAAASPLSDREIEILKLISDGLSNREIADQLFLAVGTVKWYLSEIYGKLYVTSRTQAVARARELCLLD